MGERFGKYELVRKLAVGGMAEIFLATHMGPEGFKKHVAIKRILPHLTEDQDFVTMFLDEARLVARFNHPNLVQIFELGQVKTNYFLAMEYVQGSSMSKVIKACRKKQIPFPLEYGAKILSNACEGLEYAHNFTNADGSSAESDSSRCQPAEHHAFLRRRRESTGLRYRQGGRKPLPDPDHFPEGQGRLHVSRTDYPEDREWIAVRMSFPWASFCTNSPWVSGLSMEIPNSNS